MVFSSTLGRSVDLWSVRLSSDGLVLGEPRRLTAGGLDDDHASASADGRIVYESGTTRVRLWSVALEEEHAEVAPTRVSSGVADERRPDLARRVQALLFLRDDSVWVRDVREGKERIAIEGPARGALLRPDGAQIIFRTGAEGLSLADARGGPPSEICAECRALNDWSEDGRFVLASGNTRENRGGVRLLDLETRESVMLLKRPDAGLWDPRFSPDGRWVAFHATAAGKPRQVFIAGAGDSAPIPVDQWVAVTDGTVNCSTAAWTPDGNRLYYLCDPEGAYCLYAQDLDPTTKQPVGEARIVRHFHDPRWSIPSNTGLRYEVDADRLIIPLTERTGNIWMLDPVSPDTP